MPPKLSDCVSSIIPNAILILISSFSRMSSLEPPESFPHQIQNTRATIIPQEFGFRLSLSSCCCF
jgi:hypothetical protein